MNFLILKKIKPEEAIFLTIVLSTILTKNQSYVPALVTCCLMAFYYLVFGWYLIPLERNEHILFSIFAGVIYSVCFLSLAICVTGNWEGYLPYWVQVSVILPMLIFLSFKFDWKEYRTLHYLRILVIFIINIFCLLF